MPRAKRRSGQREQGDGTNDYGLDDKQWRFVNEFIIDFKKRAAAIRAGYTEGAAAQIARKLTRDPRVKKALHDLLEERNQHWLAEQTRVIQELMSIAYANMLDFAEWGPFGVNFKHSNTLSRTQAAAICEIKQTIDKNGTQRMSLRFANKERALELLGKHIGMFREVAAEDNRGAFRKWADAQAALNEQDEKDTREE